MDIVVTGLLSSGRNFLHFMLKNAISTKHVRPHNKLPSLIVRAPWDKNRNPDLKFILCMRDIRPILCSTMGTNYELRWNEQYKINKKGEKERRGPSLLERLEEIDIVLKKTDPLIVYFEDLMWQPEQEQERIGQAFGLDFKYSFLNFFESHKSEELWAKIDKRRTKKKDFRPIEPEKAADWRDFPNKMKREFTECPYLFQVLKDWGYEQDESWFEEIK